MLMHKSTRSCLDVFWQGYARHWQAGVLMKKNSFIALLLFAVSAISIQTAAAQSQDQRNADIEQLKNKLQQLDQMMTEFKGEIKSLEGTPAPLVGQGQAEGQKTSAPQEPMIAVPSE